MPNLHAFSFNRLFRQLALTAAVALLPACKTPNDQETVEANPVRPLPFTKFTVRQAETVDDSPLVMENTEKQDKNATDIAARKTEPGNVLVERIRPADNRPQLANKPFNPSALDKGDPEEKVKLDLSLQAATVEHIVMAFADKEVLNFSYLVDPAVKGAISLNLSEIELTRKEAWELLEHLLWLSGAYMSETNNFVHVLPFEKMPKEQKLYVDHEKQPNVQAVFIDIKYRKSADVINFLKPFMTDGASAIDIPDANTIAIVETPGNVEKLLELIKRLDSKGESAWPVKCLQCHEIDPETLATELQTLLPILGFPVAAANAPSGGAIKLAPLQRLNAIVVSASMEEVLDEIAKWVKTLDHQDNEDKEGIYFYNVKYSTVEILSAALDAFFTTTTSSSPASSTSSSRSTSSTSRRSSRNSTTSNNRNNNNNNNVNRNGNGNNNFRNTASTNNASRTMGAVNNANRSNTTNGTINNATLTVFETDVTVYTDDESNRLTIKTTPRTWNTIKAFLERQDLPPRQVAIQAVITEISLDKNLEYGITHVLDHYYRHGKTEVSGGFAHAGAINDFPDPTSLAAKGIGLLFTDHDGDPLTLIQAVAGKGNTKVLSEPQIIARSGATAELQVGQSVPVVSEGTTYASSSSGNYSTSYEYVETGIIMSVTPFITAGNQVRLEVEQEISGISSTSVNANTPTLDKKKMSTELVVPDNTTILMGGMIKNENYETLSGIPLLMDIPYLGHIFRYNNYQDKRTELLILITVNVIDNKQPQEELIRKYKTSLEVIEEQSKKAERF